VKQRKANDYARTKQPYNKGWPHRYAPKKQRRFQERCAGQGQSGGAVAKHWIEISGPKTDGEGNGKLNGKNSKNPPTSEGVSFTHLQNFFCHWSTYKLGGGGGILSHLAPHRQCHLSTLIYFLFFVTALVAFSSWLEYVFMGLRCPFRSRSTCPAPLVARGSSATGRPIWRWWPLLDGYGVVARSHLTHVLIWCVGAHRAAARPHRQVWRGCDSVQFSDDSGRLHRGTTGHPHPYLAQITAYRYDSLPNFSLRLIGQILSHNPIDFLTFNPLSLPWWGDGGLPQPRRWANPHVSTREDEYIFCHTTG
jgi:hypothetical protein